MTLPTGTISMLNVQQETGANRDFNWIVNNTSPSTNNMNGLKGMTWFQRYYSEPSGRPWLQFTTGCDACPDCADVPQGDGGGIGDAGGGGGGDAGGY